MENLGVGSNASDDLPRRFDAGNALQRHVANQFGRVDDGT